MPFKAYYLDPAGELHKEMGEKEVQAAYTSGKGLLWVDISDTAEEDADFLTRVFQFHPLTIEDCVETTINTPKVEDFEDYLFMVFHGINYAGESDIIQTTEMDVFLGPHFVVTNHNLFLYSIEAIKRLVETDGRPMRRGVDFLAHALVGALVNNIAPAIDLLEEQADAIEDIIFQTPHPSTLEAILHVKRSCLRLRQAMAPQREALNRLSRHEFPRISDEAAVYCRDIYDASPASRVSLTTSGTASILSWRLTRQW